MKKKYIAPKTKYASMMLSNIIAESNTLRLGPGEGSHDANSNERNFFDDEEDDEFNW